LCHLPKLSQFSPSDGPSRDASTESESRQGTETPASSLDFDMATIDPRLMESGPITVMEPSNSTVSIETSAFSGGYPMTSTDSHLVETFERRVTRGRAKPANLEPVPRLESPPQHVTRSYRKRELPEEQSSGEQKGKPRPGKMKASTIKPTPRRSKRLRAR
jgi:hypothetical protein